MASVASWASYPAAADRLLSYIGIAFHWGILQYVLGLPFMAFIALLLYLKTRDKSWERLARTLTKGFIIVFAVGAATGTASEFGLVLLWPNLTEAAGRYIYFPLYMEIFAFLMEVVFLYMLWFGWRRLPPRALAAVAFLGFLGAWYSASMILSVNSFMVAPPGIMPAYKPDGTYLYSEGYPKLKLYVPKDVASLLDVGKLKAAGVEVLGDDGDSVLVAIPVRIVQELVHEAWSGARLADSVLVQGGFINKAVVASLTPEALKKLAERLGLPAAQFASSDPVHALLSIPVKNIVDYIVFNTVKKVGFWLVTFESPVYIATLMHSIGAGLVVSGFTAFAGYALRMLRMPENADPEYRRYVENALKFTAVFAALAIAYQGFISGHEMGVAIAHWNPEKFAAMEGTSRYVFSVSRALGLENIMPIIAYGSPNAKLPVYDLIPSDYCKCRLAGTPPVEDCRPPIILHYVYYTKIGLAILVGIYGLLIGLAAIRGRVGFVDRLLEAIGWKSFPRTLLVLAPIAAAVTQAVSNMGWVVREVGRKPWTIYGMMTVDVAHTVNPAPLWQVVLVAVYFLALVAALIYASYRVLWVAGRPR